LSSVPRITTAAEFASWLRRHGGTTAELFDDSNKTRRVKGVVTHGVPGQMIVNLYARPTSDTFTAMDAYIDLADLAHWATRLVAGIGGVTASPAAEAAQSATLTVDASSPAAARGAGASTVKGATYRLGPATLFIPSDVVTENHQIEKFTATVNDPAIALGTTGIFLSVHADRTPLSTGRTVNGSARIGIAPNGDRDYSISWTVGGADGTNHTQSKMGRFAVNSPSIRQGLSAQTVSVQVQRRRDNHVIRKDLAIVVRVFVPQVAEAVTAKA